MGNSTKLQGIKIILFRELVTKSHKEYTNSDLELLETLSKDPDIKRILNKKAEFEEE